MSLERIIRVVNLEQQNSYFNVALDEALIELVKEELVLPTLVFTEWSPTISVGYSQDVHKDVDLGALKKHNVTLVRRISGGQAVYLDQGYIVFSIVAPRSYFPSELDELRKYVCEVMVKTLNENEIPAEFYPPDNVIIKDGENIMTIGNSGQRITKNTIAVHGSIRYDLLNFENMLDILMTNGSKLNMFSEQIRQHLAYVKKFSDISKEELKNALLVNILSQFNATPHKEELKPEVDQEKIHKLKTRYESEDWIFNAVANPAPRGVCYFYLDGECIVPEIEKLLPSNKPSGLQEATIEVPNGI